MHVYVGCSFFFSGGIQNTFSTDISSTMTTATWVKSFQEVQIWPEIYFISSCVKYMYVSGEWGWVCEKEIKYKFHIRILRKWFGYRQRMIELGTNGSFIVNFLEARWKCRNGRGRISRNECNHVRMETIFFSISIDGFLLVAWYTVTFINFWQKSLLCFEFNSIHQFQSFS